MTRIQVRSEIALSEAVRRREFATFLRSRRERIKPEDVGLPTTPRRRVPGLRREEVAELADVGVTWYTWLEQGRPVRTSIQVLKGIAHALCLDAAERAHLFTLAGLAGPSQTDAQRTPPHALALLHQLDPFPAALLTARWDIIASNASYGALLGIDSNHPTDSNFLVLFFTSPRFRESLLDWEEQGARLVGRFRAAMARHAGSPAWEQLLRRVCRESPYFAELWFQHDVNVPDDGPERFVHPVVGHLRLTSMRLWTEPNDEGAFIIGYMPVDVASADKLRWLGAHTEGL